MANELVKLADELTERSAAMIELANALIGQALKLDRNASALRAAALQGDTKD